MVSNVNATQLNSISRLLGGGSCSDAAHSNGTWQPTTAYAAESATALRALFRHVTVEEESEEP